MSCTPNSMNPTSSTGYQPPDEMEIAKTSLKKRNVYDYNKMLEDFHLRDSIVKKKKEQLQNLGELRMKEVTL